MKPLSLLVDAVILLLLVWAVVWLGGGVLLAAVGL